MAVTANQSLWISSTDNVNNKVNVIYSVSCTVSGSSYHADPETGTFTIDGTSYTSTYSLPANTTTTVFYKEVTISNASKKEIKASYSFPTTPSGGTKTGSTSVTVPELLQAPTIYSFAQSWTTLEAAGASFTCSNCSAAYYKKSTDSSWTQISGGTSGTVNIDHVAPNTTYTLNLICRNYASDGTYKDAYADANVTTLNQATVSSVNNFNLGDSVNFVKSTPDGMGNDTRLRIETLNPTTTVYTLDNPGANINVTLDDNAIDAIYKKMGTSNSVTVRFTLDTIGWSTYYNWKDVTCTLVGNNKTTHVDVDGTWKRAKHFINVNGTWKRAVRWVNVNGTWKRCI